VTGIDDLEALLAGLAPRLDATEYAFCRSDGRLADHAQLRPFASVAEAEGLTLVVEMERAREAGLDREGPFRRITLAVHSSLGAVGLTAAVAGALAERGIAANVIAGFHHDHLFVPADRADDALAALRALQAASE